jgi:hypothetical protein
MSTDVGNVKAWSFLWASHCCHLLSEMLYQMINADVVPSASDSFFFAGTPNSRNQLAAYEGFNIEMQRLEL